MDLSSTNKTEWSIYKFANTGSDSVQSADRRFFTQPVIVRTINKEVTRTTVNGKDQYTYKERPFDAVLIGSGDRNRPSSESTVKNAYFMLRDYNVIAKIIKPIHPLHCWSQICMM